MKTKIKKFKESIIKFLKQTKKIIKDNPLLFIFIVGTLLNDILLRAFTVGKFYRIAPFAVDLFVTLLFASVYFLIKEKNRFKYLFILSIISTIICIANSIYYSYYSSFISVTFLSFAFTNTETGDADVVGNLLRLEYFIFIWLPICLYIVNKKKNGNVKEKYGKESFKFTLKWALISLIVSVCSLEYVSYARLVMQWNREYIVNSFGIYTYQISDVLKCIEPSMASLFGSDKARKEINDYYDNKKDNNYYNEYTKFFEGKNVIAIHAESMQQVNMDISFNGIDVTPNLNKLAKEGVYFSNFYSQVSGGTSSDTEFSVATGLLPSKVGTVFINYADREYVSMYNLLKEEGYTTVSMHANVGNFWNRNKMYTKLGYDYFYDRDSYEIDETIGFGLSDRSFVLQSVQKLKQLKEEKGKFYATLITLSNHTPFEDTDKYGYYDVSMTVDGVKYDYMENTKLGNYFKSVHYADEQIGLLIEELEKENMLDDTVIVIYGDHDARISKSEWDRFYNYDYRTNDVKSSSDETYINIDYYFYELNKKVPFIIWSNDEKFKTNLSGEITTVGGMVDVGPTIMNLLGIHNKYSLGNDLLNKENNIVVFPNGNFVTDKVYYSELKNEYKLLKDVPIEENYIENCKEYAKEILDVSNDIIVYNYFRKELSEERFEKE